MRKTPLRRTRARTWFRADDDKVTPELHAAILARDQGCLAPRLDPDVDGCRGRLTLDHVKEHAAMGKRAPSDSAHLVTLCEHHHVFSGWATSNRPALRDYLRRMEADDAG